MVANRPAFCASLAVVALLLGACSSGGGPVSSPTTTVGGRPLGGVATTTAGSAATVPRLVTTRLELLSRTVVAGQTVDGDFVVDNETGQPIRTPLCAAWEVQLTNARVPVQRTFFFKCAPGPTFAVGVHRYPFTVDTRYRCGLRPPAGVDCGGDVAPPLPPGDYHAVFLQDAMHFPVPHPLAVHVVKQQRRS